MIARGTRLDNTSSRNSESGSIEQRQRINGKAGEANLRAKMEDKYGRARLTSEDG